MNELDKKVLYFLFQKYEEIGTRGIAVDEIGDAVEIDEEQLNNSLSRLEFEQLCKGIKADDTGYLFARIEPDGIQKIRKS